MKRKRLNPLIPMENQIDHPVKHKSIITMEGIIKILIVDDSPFMRNAVSKLLQAEPQFSIVGMAQNGFECLKMARSLSPDVIILDIDMPMMDGLTALKHIMIESPVPVVIFSSLFADGAIIFEALRLGAVDFIPKPSGAISENIGKARQQLIDRIKLAHLVNKHTIRRVRLPKWSPREQLVDSYRFRTLASIL
jgi:two-component system chemotaxis response regulator CheB